MLLVYACLLCLLAGYVMFARPHWAKTAAVGFVLVGSAGLMAAVDAMGTPKPIVAEWRDLDGAPVIGFYAVANEAIYVWVLREGTPVAYQFPWSAEQARELQTSRGSMVLGTEGGEMKTYPAPQPPTPPKGGT